MHSFLLFFVILFIYLLFFLITAQHKLCEKLGRIPDNRVVMTNYVRMYEMANKFTTRFSFSFLKYGSNAAIFSI